MKERSEIGVYGQELNKESLLRHCEKRTEHRNDACMLFWTLGGNQVGKSAINGWKNVLIPNIDEIGIWPFDGNLADLFSNHHCIVAETYPGEAYSHLGIPPKNKIPWSKRKIKGRRFCVPYIEAWLKNRSNIEDSDVLAILRNGFGDSSYGEDQFDSFCGLLSMLDVVDGRRPEGVPNDETITRWEGWILGQASAQI